MANFSIWVLGLWLSSRFLRVPQLVTSEPRTPDHISILQMRAYHSLGSVVSSMQANDDLTIPSTLDGLFIALETCIWKFRSRSMMTTKSFSSVIAS